jgi:hypothetical protein
VISVKKGVHISSISICNDNHSGNKLVGRDTSSSMC